MLWSIANVSTWTFTGYNMIIFYAALRAIPAELYEAAAVDGAGAFRTALYIKLPLLRPAILLCTIFSVIGSFQLFAEPRVFYDIAPQVIGKSYTPNLYVYNLAFADQRLNYAAALSFMLGLVVFVVSFVVMRISVASGGALMSVPDRRAGRRRPHQGQDARRRAARRRKPGSSGGMVFPTIFMLAFLVYFLMPLFWLVVASTKSLDDLFDSFGLWFADFNLIDNIKDTFKQDNGVYVDWLRNTIMYSVVSAVGAALLAAAAGYGFAKFAFRGKNLMFWFVLGSVMVPTTALAIPTYLMFAKLGFTNNPLAVILPSLVSPFGIYLMRIYAEAAVPIGPDRGGPHRRRGRVPDLPQDRVPAADSGLRDRAVVQLRRDVEQLLPAAGDALGAQVVSAHRRPAAVEQPGHRGRRRDVGVQHRDHRLADLDHPADPRVRLPAALLAERPR